MADYIIHDITHESILLMPSIISELEIGRNLFGIDMNVSLKKKKVWMYLQVTVKYSQRAKKFQSKAKFSAFISELIYFDILLAIFINISTYYVTS